MHIYRRLKNLGRSILFVLLVPLLFLILVPMEFLGHVGRQIPSAFERAWYRSKMRDVPEDAYKALLGIGRAIKCVWTGEEFVREQDITRSSDRDPRLP